jgi:arginase family enzyme
LDPGEKILIQRSSITHLKDPLDILEYNFEKQSIWVHFDTDILNPDLSPAQNYPAPGGLGREDLERVFRHLAQTGLVRAVSLSSWAPDLEGAERSKRVSMDLLGVLCGS